MRRFAQHSATQPRSLLQAAVVLVVIALALAFAGPAYADEAHNMVASEKETAAAKTLLLEGMSPIDGRDVVDGTYEIEAESSSPFFKIKSAKLIVQDGKMTAELGLDSKSYPLIYMGTAQQAAAAPASDYIEFDGDSWTFTVPVSALDQEIDCAAYSKRRKQWYSRKLMFYAASLPDGALRFDPPVYGNPIEAGSSGAASAADDKPAVTVHDDGYEAVAIDMPDGEYSIEVNMTGGSGRASVSSPTWLIVKDGHAYARLLWSSSYYDYMIVDEVRYDNLTDDGSNSTFIIPITEMDDEIDVVADTTAMGDPVEVEYHLTFYSATIDDKDAIPQEAAIKVLVIAVVVIVVGGVLNYVLKKRSKR